MRQRALIQDRQSDIECELSDTYSELALAKDSRKHCRHVHESTPAGSGMPLLGRL